MLLGIMSSLAATVFWAILLLIAKASWQHRRAKNFIGTYTMHTPNGSATGGKVTFLRNNWWDDLLSPTPSLRVFAEQGTGRKPGTQDWIAVVELRGFSNTATGYYSYQDRSGGSLRFELYKDGEITEYGTPFDSSAPFILRLIRVGSKHS